MTSVGELRRCIIEGLPDETAAELYRPLLGQIYVPPGHHRALSLDAPLVLGERGAGKSLWLDALRDEGKRVPLATTFDLPDLSSCRVSVGYCTDEVDLARMPDSRTLEDLLTGRHDAFDIWSAVVLSNVAPEALPKDANWSGRVSWVECHQGEVSEAFHRAEMANRAASVKHLVLFDGLDTTAQKWQDIQDLLKGLLMLAREFRRYRAIRLKLFLRPDMLERKAVAFPDSSKLTNSPARLDWADRDLYGLLFQYLGNATATGKQFREFVKDYSGESWKKDGAGYPLPNELRDNIDLQRGLFHAIAGKAMGGGTNRGDTWKWLPNHLADAWGHVSPRSFIAAVHQAAVLSNKMDSEAKSTPLLWRAVREGVSFASHIRVAELVQEDFPWIADVLKPLRGIAVPCEEKEVLHAWKKDNTLQTVLNHNNRLPPTDIDAKQPATLLDALIKLGVFSRRRDSRIDVPDIFRIDAGMPRRGGVPVRKTAVA